MTNNPQLLKQIYNGTYATALFSVLSGHIGLAVSTMIAGNLLESTALAGIGLVYPFTLLSSVIATVFSSGGVLVFSKLMGKREYAKAREVRWASFLGCILFYCITAVPAIIFMRPLLHLMEVPVELFDSAYRSGVIVLATGAIYAVGGIASGFLRLDGHGRIVRILNIALAVAVSSATPIFIIFVSRGIDGLYGAFGFTCILGGSSMIFALRKKTKETVLTRISIRIFFRHSLRIIQSGFVSASEEVYLFFCMPLINAFIIGTYGIAALSAYSVYSRVYAMFLGFTVAGAQGMTVLLGVFIGERDSVSARQAISDALKKGIWVCMTAGIAVILLARPLCMLFGLAGDPEALRLAVSLMFVVGIKIPLAMLANLFINVNNSYGRLLISNLLCMGKAAVFLLPAMYFLSARFEISGVWHSFWICEAVTVITALVYSFARSGRNSNLSRIWLIDREYELNGKYMSFSCSTDMEEITRRSKDAAAFCHFNCLVPARSILISLAVEEMLALTAVHAEIGESEYLDTRIVVYSNEVIIRIRNGGKEFNPLYYYPAEPTREEGAVKADAGLTADEMLDLGDKLGIKMIRACAKNIDYRRTFGVNNLTVAL